MTVATKQSHFLDWFDGFEIKNDPALPKNHPPNDEFTIFSVITQSPHRLLRANQS